MKIKYIILIFAIVFGSFFCFRDCVRQAHLKSDELKLTPISYVFTKDIWTQLDTCHMAGQRTMRLRKLSCKVQRTPRLG